MVTEKPILTDGELAIGLLELSLAGYLNFKGEDEFEFTTEGLVYALKVLQSLEPKDRIAVLVFRDWLRR